MGRCHKFRMKTAGSGGKQRITDEIGRKRKQLEEFEKTQEE